MNRSCGERRTNDEKEHGQVTGIIWRGPADLAAYQQLRAYAEQRQLTVSAAAKELVIKALNNAKS
ncbi:MAG: hypothetical protein ACLSH6_08350 [Limosilactobacillus pontis]